MRYSKTDTLPNLPFHQLKKEGLEITQTDVGWQASDADKARALGLKVDDEGYLLK